MILFVFKVGENFNRGNT